MIQKPKDFAEHHICDTTNTSMWECDKILRKDIYFETITAKNSENQPTGRIGQLGTEKEIYMTVKEAMIIAKEKLPS